MGDALPGDVLDAAYIRSLAQPLWWRDFPIVKIDVETGYMAIDAGGQLSGLLISDIRRGDLRDSWGREVHEGDLWLDPAYWVAREPPAEVADV